MIKENNKTHIIAEMAYGHDGSIEQALKLMHASLDAGADSISIHITELSEMMVRHYGSGEGKVSSGREKLNIYKYLESINISFEEWLKFSKELRKTKLDLVVMPNDLKSFEFAEKELNPDYYVISAACFVEKKFLEKVALSGRKTFFRIGGAYLGEIENAINIFKKCGNSKIILLHGFQNYPTKLEESNISLLKNLKEIFNLEVGLADHIDGGDEIASVIPILSLAYGATYIEKHITLDRNKKSEDFESALNPEDFKKFVRNVRAAEISIGNKYFTDLNEATLKYRNITRKRIVAANKIYKGDLITEDNITFKRSDIGLTPDMLECILQRRANEDIEKDESITLTKLV